MKSAEEWFQELKTPMSKYADALTVSEVKDIQLDSYKAGLKAAADECDKCVVVEQGNMVWHDSRTPKEIKSAIIKLKDKTTELPKE